MELLSPYYQHPFGPKSIFNAISIYTMSGMVARWGSVCKKENRLNKSSGKVILQLVLEVRVTPTAAVSVMFLHFRRSSDHVTLATTKTLLSL